MAEFDRAYHFACCLRMVVVLICRGAALVLAFKGVMTLIHGSIWYLERRPLLASGMIPTSEEYEWFYIGMGQLVPAVLLAAFGALIARWLVPAPPTATCLRCGYSTEKLTTPKCPECGAPVPLDRD